MPAYLITGGLGVVGSRAVERAAMSGCRVTVVDAAEHPRNRWTADRLRLRLGPMAPAVVEERLERIPRGDLADMVRGCDAVLHFAAHTGIPHSAESPDDDWASNVDATRNLLEAVRAAGGRTPLVITSSVKPYGTAGIPAVEEDSRFSWEPGFAGVDEGFPMDPDEPYAASKLAQSALGTAYARSYGMPVCVLRCSNLYGDAPCHGPRHGWLTWFCIAAALDLPIELQGSGKQTRDVLFSDDVADAASAALRSPAALSGTAYNLGGGPDNALSCREAVALISELLGRKVRTVPGPGRPNEDMLFVTDSSRFRRDAGWSPKVGVRDGVRRILEWAGGSADSLRELYGEA